MYVGTRCRTWHRIVKRQKGNALASEIVHQRFPFTAVRAQRHVHRIAMIEAEMIVNTRLTKSADRKRVLESRCKIHLDLGCVGPRPMRWAVVADQRRCRLISADSRWTQLFELSL